MKEAEQKSIRRELRIWAGFYNRLLGEDPSEEKVKKMDQQLEKLLKGKWFGRITESHEFYIPRRDGTKLRLLIVMKKNHTHSVHEQDTGVLWIHGGGYMLGLPEIDFMFADQFLENDDAVMILPDYRKALEAPYPAALDDCMLTLDWMHQYADVLGINKNQLFVGGESAGGGLTCAVTLRARDEGKIKIAFSMPLYPMISNIDTDSSKDSHMPVWNTSWNHLGWKLYTGELKEESPYLAPIHETDYHNLPPAFTLVSDIEPFYNETKEYFHSLYNADIPVMLKEYHGCFHAFDMLALNTSISRKARQLEKKVFAYAQANFYTNQTRQEVKPEDAVISSLQQAIDAHEDILEEPKKDADESSFEQEDVVGSLQKIIEDDTADSLRSIERMIDKMH